MVESRKEAHSIELQNYCYNSAITLIRGLTQALKMDLSLFSTKSLLEIAPNHEVRFLREVCCTIKDNLFYYATYAKMNKQIMKVFWDHCTVILVFSIGFEIKILYLYKAFRVAG